MSAQVRRQFPAVPLQPTCRPKTSLVDLSKILSEEGFQLQTELDLKTTFQTNLNLIKIWLRLSKKSSAIKLVQSADKASWDLTSLRDEGLALPSQTFVRLLEFAFKSLGAELCLKGDLNKITFT